MGIIRVEKKEKYAVIINAPLEDKRLSFGARGILAYLLTKPDGWKVWSRDLYNQSPAGRKAVDRMLGELKTYGYLRRQRVQDEQGRWSWLSTVYENPSHNPDYDPETHKVRKSPKNPSTPERPKSDNRIIRQSDNPAIGFSDGRNKGDIINTDPTNTELSITDGRSPDRERETPSGATSSPPSSAREIYLAVTRIRSLDHVPEKVVDWLQDQEKYMSVGYHPEALRAAIKAADKEGKESLFDPERLAYLFYHHLPQVDNVQYDLYREHPGYYRIAEIQLTNGKELSPDQVPAWILKSAKEIIETELKEKGLIPREYLDVP